MKKIWLTDLAVVLLAVITSTALALQGDTYALVTCLLTVACVAVVHALFFCFKLTIPYFMYCLILLFIVMAMICGKMLDFYNKIPSWDFYLHLVSGVFLAFIGYLFYYHLVRFERPQTVKFGLPCWFVFLFSSAAAGIWEIFEFSGDMLLGLQSQGGSLVDTMSDIIAGNIGCLVALFFIIRHERGKHSKVILKMLEEGKNRFADKHR